MLFTEMAIALALEIVTDAILVYMEERSGVRNRSIGDDGR
jgi:hypothetical protein